MANPDSARSYEGDVVLDEFAFHLDARKVYEAIEPSITRGYSIEIISTPNGQRGEYYKLAKAAGWSMTSRNPIANGQRTGPTFTRPLWRAAETAMENR